MTTTKTEAVPVILAAETNAVRDQAQQTLRANEAIVSAAGDSATKAQTDALLKARFAYDAADAAWRNRSRGFAPGTPGTQIDREADAQELHLASAALRNAPVPAADAPQSDQDAYKAIVDAQKAAQTAYMTALVAHEAWRTAHNGKLSPYFPTEWSKQ